MKSIDDEVRTAILAAYPDLTPTQVEGAIRFRSLLVDENQRQNLTRLTSPTEFVEGHLSDVVELQRTGWVPEATPESAFVDLGSGGGVPGLLHAAVFGGAWILVDSERRKTEFLASAAKELGVEDRVEIRWGRIEDVQSTLRAGRTIVARAVGPVHRMHGWLRPCSTWNMMILFKGPAWDEEWASDDSRKARKELSILDEHSYQSPLEKRSRRLLRLKRVPRGTSK